MAKQIQKTKSTQETKKEVEEVQPKVSEKAEELKNELDDLLDSIDEALGEEIETAQDFINQFIQKGGQLSEVLLSMWYNVKEGFRRTLLHLPIGGFNGNMQGAWL